MDALVAALGAGARRAGVPAGVTSGDVRGRTGVPARLAQALGRRIENIRNTVPPGPAAARAAEALRSGDGAWTSSGTLHWIFALWRNLISSQADEGN